MRTGTSLLLLSLIVGCFGDSTQHIEWEDATALPSASNAPPLQSDFRLEMGNLVAGQSNLIRITGAPPSSIVRLVRSRAGLGDGPCPTLLNGRCLPILGPVSLLTGVQTDAQGHVTASLVLPAGVGGSYISFAGVVTDGTTQLSNGVGRVVHPAGTAISLFGDLDGDGATPADGDCHDLNANIGPGAVDTFGDGFDANCDDADGVDRDGDGFVGAPGGPDCDDTAADVFPGAPERCDGYDNNCNGQIDEQLVCMTSETFRVTTPVDLLFVVDDSCSMSDEQDQLSSNFGSYIQTMLDALVPFHLGVITTDTLDPTKSGRLQPLGERLCDDSCWTSGDGTCDDGGTTSSLSSCTLGTDCSDCGPRYTPSNAPPFLDGSTSDAAALFELGVQVGTAGHFDEMGLQAAQMALTEPLLSGDNAGFLREEADLHIVFVSDEDDYSPTLSSSDFLTWLQSLKSPAFQTRAHAITGPPGNCPTSYESGTSYLDVSYATGGSQISICEPDYSVLFDDILDTLMTRNVGAGDGPSFVLSSDADPATIGVTVEDPFGHILLLGPSDWTYDASTRTLEVVGIDLALGSVVTIHWAM